jgi:hypothetical protein
VLSGWPPIRRGFFIKRIEEFTMKKVIICLLILVTSSCVNGKVEVPDQSNQDKDGIVNIIQFKF